MHNRDIFTHILEQNFIPPRETLGTKLYLKTFEALAVNSDLEAIQFFVHSLQHIKSSDIALSSESLSVKYFKEGISLLGKNSLTKTILHLFKCLNEIDAFAYIQKGSYILVIEASAFILADHNPETILHFLELTQLIPIKNESFIEDVLEISIKICDQANFIRICHQTYKFTLIQFFDHTKREVLFHILPQGDRRWIERASRYGVHKQFY
ncbi:hypothetical protein MXB_1191 [Myxobolus squamalis]|nr:hypothetical protein MXB_1191 [Myxobolus squamalis]